MLKDKMDVYIEFFGEIAADIMKMKLEEKKKMRKEKRKDKTTDQGEEKEDRLAGPTEEANALMEVIASGQVEEKEAEKEREEE